MNLVICLFLIILFYAWFFYSFEKLNNQFNTYDYPSDKRKIHQKPVSFMGGGLILFSLNIYSTMKIIGGDTIFFELDIKNSLILLLFLNIFFAIGLLDDLKKISLKSRIILLSICIIIFIIFCDLSINELQFKYFENKIFIPNYLSILFTFFCIFIFLNALNMYDGINGQSGSYIIFFCLILFFLNTKIDLIILIIFLIIFFYFNIKNKFFIGNSGINFLAILLSYFVIKLYKMESSFNVEQILLLMFLPGIELIRLFFSRILKNKNPFKADDNHIHHILRKRFKLGYILFINNLLAFTPFFFVSIINLQSLVILNIVIYFYIVFRLNSKS